MGDQSQGYTLDEALSNVGFGTFQGLALVFAGMGLFAEAAELNLLSFIGPAVKSEWSLSPTEESYLSSAVFAGMLAGAVFWGLISDTYGRRIGMQSVAVTMVGAGILSAFSPDYKTLVVLRCFLGFGVAGGIAFTSWFLEFIPTSNRGAWMFCMLVFWILGEIFEASLAWIIMPRLGWRWLLALSSVPCLLVLIFSFLVPESPRYLLMKGRISKSVDVLNQVALINRKELPRGVLVSDQKMHLDEEISSSEETSLLSIQKKTHSLQTFTKIMSELFSPDYWLMTLLFLLLNIGYAFAYYGIVLIISSLSSEQSTCGSSNVLSKNVHDANLYRNVLITSSAEFPGLMIAMTLVERVGRKRTMEILTLLAFTSILPLSFLQNDTVAAVLLLCSRMLLSASFGCLGIYGKEVYPTSIRGTGSGLGTSAGRIGGIICPLVAVGLVRGCHQTLAVILFGIIILVSGICVMFFPFETKGRGLSDIVGNQTTLP